MCVFFCRVPLYIIHRHAPTDRQTDRPTDRVYTTDLYSYLRSTISDLFGNAAGKCDTSRGVLFMPWYFSYFPSPFPSRRRAHHFCFYFNLLWERAQLKLLFINLATFTRTPNRTVPYRTEPFRTELNWKILSHANAIFSPLIFSKFSVQFSVFFFVRFWPKSRIRIRRTRGVCDSARCQRKTVSASYWKYFRAEIFLGAGLREKLSGKESLPRSGHGCACLYFRQARDAENLSENLQQIAPFSKLQ